MAIIQPDGLFNGKRLLACSDQARLFWPYLFLAANSFGRLEIDYDSIRRHVFVDFKKFPKSSEFLEILREYRDNGLLFLYEYEGRVWGQWDCKPGSLPNYKTGKDRQSPEPPAEDFENWRKISETFRNSHLLQTKALTNISENFENLLKISDRRGVGVGVGVGKESTLAGAKETAQAPHSPPNGKHFTAPTEEQVREYAESIGYAIDAERFCAYHGSRGWVVGRAPMKDWRKAIVTWRSHEASTPSASAGKSQRGRYELLEDDDAAK